MPAKPRNAVANTTDTKPKAELTDQEQAAARRLLERRDTQAPAPKFKVKYDGDRSTKLSPANAQPSMTNVLMCDVLNSADDAFVNGALDQIANIARHGQQLTEQELNFMLAAVHGIEPRDQTESLLAIQMIGIHNALMVMIRRLNHCETIPQQDSANNAINKLGRTFCAQLETLKRYRSKGEQVVRVERVTVGAGGQAVIGNVQTGGGAPKKSGDQPHEPCGSHEPGPALLSAEQAVRVPLPCSGEERLDRLPVPRSRRRSAGGTR